MQKSILFILFAVCCLACNNNKNNKQAQQTGEIPFDKTKWAVKQGPDYPHRDNMLNDLMYGHELHDISKDSLTSMLGQPSRTDSLYLFYRIAQKRIGFFPLHTTTLVFKLHPDSTVLWIKVHK